MLMVGKVFLWMNDMWETTELAMTPKQLYGYLV